MPGFISISWLAGVESLVRRLLEDGFKGHLDVFARELLDRSGPVLDCGCGEGTFAGLFKAYEYTGIDASDDSIQRARRRFPGHRFLTMDAASMAFGPAVFDRCFVAGVLHHLDFEQTRKVLSELRRVLRDDGILIVWEDVPARSPWNILGFLAHRLDKGHYLRPADQYRRQLSEFFHVEAEYPMKSGVMDYSVFRCTPKSEISSGGTPRPFFSIVIPVFNSAGTLESLVEQTFRELDKFYRLEIILVNDASSDSSEEVCVRLHQKHGGRLKVLSLATNAGEFAAVLAGLKCARGDYIVTMDDDGQNPPSQIPLLAERLVTGELDVVYGAYQRKRHALWRNAASTIYGIFASLILKKPLHLYLSSFRAMRRDLLNVVLSAGCTSPYIDTVILKKTKRVGQAVVYHEPRRSGKSGYSPGKLLSLFVDILCSSISVFGRGSTKGKVSIRQTWGVEPGDLK